MIRSESTSAFGQPSETKLICGAVGDAGLGAPCLAVRGVGTPMSYRRLWVRSRRVPAGAGPRAKTWTFAGALSTRISAKSCHCPGSFDDLVGARQQRGRHREAECLSGLEV